MRCNVCRRFIWAVCVELSFPLSVCSLFRRDQLECFYLWYKHWNARRSRYRCRVAFNTCHCINNITVAWLYVLCCTYVWMIGTSEIGSIKNQLHLENRTGYKSDRQQTLKQTWYIREPYVSILIVIHMADPQVASTSPQGNHPNVIRLGPFMPTKKHSDHER